MPRRSSVDFTQVGAYYKTRAAYGVGGSRAADGYSPETEPQRDQVRDYFARKAAPFDGLSCGAFKLKVVQQALKRPLGCRVKPTCREFPGVDPVRDAFPSSCRHPPLGTPRLLPRSARTEPTPWPLSAARASLAGR